MTETEASKSGETPPIEPKPTFAVAMTKATGNFLGKDHVPGFVKGYGPWFTIEEISVEEGYQGKGWVPALTLSADHLGEDTKLFKLTSGANRSVLVAAAKAASINVDDDAAYAAWIVGRKVGLQVATLQSRDGGQPKQSIQIVEVA